MKTTFKKISEEELKETKEIVTIRSKKELLRIKAELEAELTEIGNQLKLFD